MKRIKRSPKQFIASFLLLVALLASWQSTTLALTPQERRNYAEQGITFIDDFCLADTNAVDQVTLEGNDNAEKVFNYFKDKGDLTTAQISGIIGNLMQESRIIPYNEQKGGPAKGIAQWEGNRLTNLYKFAEDRDSDWKDLGIQLLFMTHEFETYEKGSYAALKATSTPEDAAQAFSDKYERPGVPVIENRIRYAQQAYARFAGEGDTDASITSVCGAGSTDYLNKFIVYNQYDPAWRYKAYGTTTIGEGGCGPSALAMVLTNMLGERITPDVVGRYAASQGMQIPGVGSSWDITRVVAAHYGLQSKFLGPDEAKINDALRNGALIVASGAGPLPYTSGGHFIVIRAITDDGKWRIGDSGHVATNGKDWDPSQILPYTRTGNVYAVSKEALPN